MTVKFKNPADETRFVRGAVVHFHMDDNGVLIECADHAACEQKHVADAAGLSMWGLTVTGVDYVRGTITASTHLDAMEPAYNGTVKIGDDT